MATVKDVAQLAQVSVGTVSKVLSNDQTVKEALRGRVMKAVSDLNYRPNMAARALRTSRASIIGLVVPDITNPFFAQLAKDIETEAARRGHTVMLTNS
ncbi:MAG: LacI family DNA-binding transcriptional regulator, partial [Pseudomonadota bacterium]